MPKKNDAIRDREGFLSSSICQEWHKELLAKLEAGLCNICAEVVWSEEELEVKVNFWVYNENSQKISIGSINLEKGLNWQTEFNILVGGHTIRMKELTRELNNEIQIIRCLTVPTGL